MKDDGIGGKYSVHVKMRNRYTILIGKSQGKSLRERLKCRWVSNIKVKFGGTSCGMDENCSAKGPVVFFIIR